MPLEIALRCTDPLAFRMAMQTNGTAEFRVCLLWRILGAANQRSQTTIFFVRDEEISHRRCPRTFVCPQSHERLRLDAASDRRSQRQRIHRKKVLMLAMGTPELPRHHGVERLSEMS